MKRTFTKVSCSLFIALAFLLPQFAKSQSNTTFDIEVSATNNSVSVLLPMSGNRSGMIIHDQTMANSYLRIFNSSGTQTANVNITSAINWAHTNHFDVDIAAIVLNNDNILIVNTARSNSTGIATYNARYVVINENGTVQSSGQLNTNDAGAGYMFNLKLAKLSDGKIAAAWSKSSTGNLAFRLISATGTPTGSDVLFAGPGTSSNYSNLYDLELAAGKNGNFIITATPWDNGLRAFVFNNSGVSVNYNSAANFAIDPNTMNQYSNFGVIGLPNGNFVAAWSEFGSAYFKILGSTGSTVVNTTTIEFTYYSAIVPVNTVGSEGFILTKQKYQDEYDMMNPYEVVSFLKFNQSGVLQTTTSPVENLLLQPKILMAPGSGAGFVYMYQYYKSYHVDWDMMMAYPDGDMDIKASTFDFVSMSTLPVALIGYDARLLSNQQVQLSWKTASENNSSHFDIEKSKDGRNFTRIGRVEAKGNSNTVSDYSFIDGDVITTNTYYRLKQFDIDGKSKDLGTRLVRTASNKALSSAFPNPVQGNSITLVAGDQPLPLPYRITDATGRVIASGTMRQQQEEINLHISEGIYFLQVGKQVIKIKK
jgi:hypothetical protein